MVSFCGINLSTKHGQDISLEKLIFKYIMPKSGEERRNWGWIARTRGLWMRELSQVTGANSRAGLDTLSLVNQPRQEGVVEKERGIEKIWK